MRLFELGVVRGEARPEFQMSMRYVSSESVDIADPEGVTEMSFWTWHRRQTTLWQQRLGLDEYQLLWVALLKGVFLGVLLTLWLA